MPKTKKKKPQAKKVIIVMPSRKGARGRPKGRRDSKKRKPRTGPAERPNIAFNPNGRPPELTEEVIAEFIARLNRCFYMETAAHAMGVCRTAICKWRRRGNEEIKRLGNNPDKPTEKSEEIYVKFVYELKRSLAESEARLAAGIETHGNVSWQALAWLAERRFNKHWGKKAERLEVTGKDGNELKQVQIFLPSNHRERTSAGVIARETSLAGAAANNTDNHVDGDGKNGVANA